MPAPGILHDLDYERHPDLETGAPAGRKDAVRGRRTDRLHRRCRPGAADQARGADSEMGEEEDEAAVQPRAEVLGPA